MRQDIEYLSNNWKTRRTERVSFRRNRGRLDGSGQKDSEGWGIENEIEREREREEKRNQPRDTSPQKTRRVTREEERLSGTPKSGMGAWVEWVMVGTRETRRPARTPIGGGDSSGPRGGKWRHSE